MRIIAGAWRGRLLPGTVGEGVRPATDKVRGAIFNIFQNRVDLRGADILDLFAGTGSLGFEALSRGARSVTFVDNDRAAVRAIRENAAALGCADACDVVQSDADGFLRRPGGPYRLVFADPPYAYTGTGGLPAKVLSSGILEPGGYLVVEHRRGTAFTGLPDGSPVLAREFGSTEVSFFVPTTETTRSSE